ncbi:helix-turn-helix domain-containing protein [Streptomyces sp. NPDC047141]|uniref:helix-turn-helix domain-containing protein n=1 Tax=Streptomyces sp. NPDC047141 TaxID=3155738 RepID=UPI0033C3DEEE
MVFQKDVDRAKVGPERYELAVALRDLAQRLGVSLSRYAVRVSWDRSTLSRFFSGALVPPAEFVEQLLENGDRETRTELTPAAKDLVRKLHRTALRATSPASGALQDLRDQLTEADRESRHFQQEARLLREVIRRAQEQLDEQQFQLRQLESTGAAERLEHRIALEQRSEDFEAMRTERDSLRESLARHKAELEEAQHRAYEAELRCAALERQLETAETEAEEDEARGEATSALSPKTLRSATPTRQSTAGDSVSFHLGFDAALGARLWRTLDEQAPVPLTEEELQKMIPRPGIFQLIRKVPYLSPEIVYVGKSERPLPDQLDALRRKILGRRGILPEEMYLTYMHIEDDMSAVAPERLLIRYLKEEHGAQLPWNLNGFGNKDAGRERDHSELSPQHFNMIHPIDLDWALRDDGTRRTWPPKEFADFIKAGLPYRFRHKLGPEYLEAAPLVVPEGPLSADAAFRLLARSLGDTWQISALKGHVLLYQEHTEYPSAVRYYRGENVQNAKSQGAPTPK